jgi:hypothetical protein
MPRLREEREGDREGEERGKGRGEWKQEREEGGKVGYEGSWEDTHRDDISCLIRTLWARVGIIPRTRIASRCAQSFIIAATTSKYPEVIMNSGYTLKICNIASCILCSVTRLRPGKGQQPPRYT